MNKIEYDIAIVGAGPVGLMCAYLARKCQLTTIIIDKSDGPLTVGRADALNARTLQLLEIIGLFEQLYKLGKTCNTSSIWQDGQFVSRQSSWWDALEGCFHKHFLMLGQSYLENLLDEALSNIEAGVLRQTSVNHIQVDNHACQLTLSNGKRVTSRYLIGADGAHSFVRQYFDIPFKIVRPQITWAVIDGVIKSDFPKVPEIIVFQAETSDVAWIPREGNLDRFYVRMDRADFTIDDVLVKINRAMFPHLLTFEAIHWFSQFSVKESVVEKYRYKKRVFLAGDACHVHSVNGGQGLNTGLADAFNLIWKLNMVLNYEYPENFLSSYESERKPVAERVIETSGRLVRATKYSDRNTHARDYVDLIKAHAGNITGMGIRYGGTTLVGTRLFDFKMWHKGNVVRIYSLLNYARYTLLVFGTLPHKIKLPDYIRIIVVGKNQITNLFENEIDDYTNKAILIRPDAYIEAMTAVNNIDSMIHKKSKQLCL